MESSTVDQGTSFLSLGCYGLFTCIAEKCKSCPLAFDCSRDSGSKVAYRVMIRAQFRMKFKREG